MEYHNQTNQQIELNDLENIKVPYRMVFTVDMLHEGWDVLNLFDIVSGLSLTTIVFVIPNLEILSFKMFARFGIISFDISRPEFFIFVVAENVTIFCFCLQVNTRNK